MVLSTDLVPKRKSSGGIRRLDDYGFEFLCWYSRNDLGKTKGPEVDQVAQNLFGYEVSSYFRVCAKHMLNHLNSVLNESVPILAGQTRVFLEGLQICNGLLTSAEGSNEQIIKILRFRSPLL